MQNYMWQYCIEQRCGRNNDETWDQQKENEGLAEGRRRAGEGQAKEKKRKNKRVKGESQPLALAGRRDPIGILAGTRTPSSANSTRIMLSLYSYREMRLEVQICWSRCCDPRVQPREKTFSFPNVLLFVEQMLFELL